MAERVNSYYMVGRTFDTNGTLDDLNQKLADTGLTVEVYSPNDRPNYQVKRKSGLIALLGRNTEYRLVHDNPQYGGDGKHSLRRVVIGEVINYTSAVRADFSISSQSGKTLVVYIKRVGKDFRNPDVILVEQRDDSE